MVFTYKIESQDYLTVSDLIESGGLESFELKQGEDFDTFDHTPIESNEHEGKIYFINQEDLNIIVVEINKVIQKHRRHLNMGKGGAVHIVSSEHAAGTLRVGLKRPKTVIGFPDYFSIGPLWKLDLEIGQANRNQWLYDHINLEQDDYEYQNKFTNTLRQIEDIPDYVPIYIWYANNASEQTGLRFMLYLLRDKTNKIYLLNSIEHSHTGLMEPVDIRSLFEQVGATRPLSDKERYMFYREWEVLSETKEVLRLWTNNEIESVKENYYDPLLIDTIKKLHNEQETKDFIKTARVIGEIIIHMNGEICDFFLEYRIRQLIYGGLLEIKGVPRSMRNYSVKLR